ncbi:MAG TPA: hypothetical protein VMY18_10245 [Acidobacteriota bacterium]|nr:hypothetical protein [Acidobacteriota bacterium]
MTFPIPDVTWAQALSVAVLIASSLVVPEAVLHAERPSYSIQTVQETRLRLIV